MELYAKFLTHIIFSYESRFANLVAERLVLWVLDEEIPGSITWKGTFLN